MIWRRISWILFWIMLPTSCTKMCEPSRGDLSPEQVVEAYLDIALNMTEVAEYEDLLEFTTGNLKDAIQSASPDTIKAAYVDRRYEIETYSVVERRDRTPRETEITFLLAYHDLGDGKSTVDQTPKITTENTVSVVKEKGIWLIRDVVGNKTSFDFPISEESRITAKAP
jgi:alpha-D-ribose 1-methylphosphonate 5-triphosphate synthase subunit PhnH